MIKLNMKQQNYVDEKEGGELKPLLGRLSRASSSITEITVGTNDDDDDAENDVEKNFSSSSPTIIPTSKGKGVYQCINAGVKNKKSYCLVPLVVLLLLFSWNKHRIYENN